MKIIKYKAQGKDWQLCGKGDGKTPFFTTATKPEKFKDGRTARGHATKCKKFAVKNLNWKDCEFKLFSIPAEIDDI